MGSAARRKPKRLAEKLLTIRTALGLSQNGLIRRLGFTDDLTQAEISMFERGIRVPSLPVLLEYARAAGAYMEVLVDDGLNLPENLPTSPKSEGIRSNRSEARKKSR
jgi:transcriptional regulator with XRE-family HTH domain